MPELELLEKACPEVRRFREEKHGAHSGQDVALWPRQPRFKSQCGHFGTGVELLGKGRLHHFCKGVAMAT